jgi:hypothetical protein
MRRTLVYEKKYGACAVQVHHLPEHGTLVYEMSGYMSEKDIDPYLTDLLEAVREYTPRGMVADPRKMKVLNDSLQAAIQARFWPAIAELGVRRNPAIVPSSVITTGSVNRMVTTAGQSIPSVTGNRSVEVAVLPTLDDCLAWIAARDRA